MLQKCNDCQPDDDAAVEKVILETLPTLSPSLLLKLRQAEHTTTDTTSSSNSNVQQAAQHVNRILQQRLELGRDTLRQLLEAGELRQLDARIGAAARAGHLDAAFFHVLAVNLKDAMENDNSAEEETRSSASDDGDDTADKPEPPTTSRLQILRHVYTRCQEEVEKTIAPGTALLNKLLRTEQAPIRANLYQHYLTTTGSTQQQPKTITTPDGKTIELKPSGNGGKPTSLVPLDEFIAAIETAVLQIRNVESAGAGGIDRESAAMMVESCRQIAKEARLVVGESYGRDSDELRQFEAGLQPVFRPASPDSPYVAGGAAQEDSASSSSTSSSSAAPPSESASQSPPSSTS